MPKLNRSFFPAVLLAALCSSFALAQVEPGSLDDLLRAEFAPLNPATNSPEQLPDLNAPLLMPPQGLPQQSLPQQSREVGPKVQLPPVPQLPPAPQLAAPQLGPPASVLEIPRVTPGEPAPEALLLPELTMPTPENSGAGVSEERRVLRPQLEARSEDQLELLPFDDRDSIRARTPQMRTPQALPYGANGSSGLGSNSRTYRSRSRLVAIPLQIEFFTVTQRYVPYGGYGVRPYGGYRPTYVPSRY